MTRFKFFREDYFMDFCKFVLESFSFEFTTQNYEWIFEEECLTLCRELFNERKQPDEAAKIIERWKRINLIKNKTK